MNKKIMAMLISSMLVISMGVGCSTKDNKIVSTSETSSTQVTAEKPAEEVVEIAPEDVEGELVYWSYTDSANNLVKAFNDVYPNVKFDVQIFGGDEYKTKILTALQSGQNMPDIFDLEENYVYEFLDSDLIEDLSFMDIETLTKDFYDFQIAGMKDSTGKFKGMSFQSSPVGLWYIRDAAEKWLGTSDPKEIEAKLQGWDQILETAKEVKEKSNGEVYLWPNMAEMAKVEAFSFEPLVRDGKLIISDDWMNLVESMRKMYNSGYNAELGSWSSEWATAWNDGKLLFRAMPCWDFFTDWDKNDGNVGIVVPFEASYEGVTLTSIYSKSNNKEIAAHFFKYVLSDEFQKINMEAYNQVPASRRVTKELAQGFSADKFGGQNLLETYGEICENIVGITPDKYTRSAQNLFRRHAANAIKEGKDNDFIVASFKEELKDKYPEVQID